MKYIIVLLGIFLLLILICACNSTTYCTDEVMLVGPHAGQPNSGGCFNSQQHMITEPYGDGILIRCVCPQQTDSGVQ